MPLGHKLKIYTDHKKLINLITVSKSPQIQRWWWTIEEFVLDLKYINEARNVVADALSRLDTEMSHSAYDSDAIPELFKNSDDKSLIIDYPLSTAVIAEHQQKETKLVRHIQRHPEYFTKQVDGHDFVLLNYKIYIPRALRKEILKWYHMTLHHPGIIRTEKFIWSDLTWPGMRTDIEEYIQKCRICQLYKIPRKNTVIFQNKTLIRIRGILYVLIP
jgi:Integrase zinc binding domain